MIGNTSVDLVSTFCNATTDPLFTLPKEFCDCEKRLRSPLLAGVVILVSVLMISTSLVTWHVTTGNIAIKFSSLPESKRREFMVRLATELRYKELCEAKKTECAAWGVSPSQLSMEKVSSSSSTTLCWNSMNPN